MSQDEIHCTIPGCQRDVTAQEGLPETICEHHLSLPRAHLRARLATTARRLAAIESYWSDDATFDVLVANDRYVQLSHVTCVAQESFEAAWGRFKLAILSAEAGNAGAAKAGPPLRAAG